MKIRSYKVLYTILLESLKEGDKENYFNSGICGQLKDIYENNIISWDEYDKLIKHFASCKPTPTNKYRSFYTHYLFKPTSPWWWKSMYNGQKYRDIRINFVEAIISNFK